MEHDRWSWFAGGVVLGLLIGGGIAGGYAMTKVAAAEKARAEAEEAMQMMMGPDVGGARGSVPLYSLPIEREAP